MNRTVLGAVTGLLSTLGYMPTPAGLLGRLPHLHGTYRRSPSDRIFHLIFSIALMCFSAFLMGLVIYELRNRHDLTMIAVLGFAICAFSALAVLLYRRAGMHYQFNGGTLTALSTSGRALWTEPLVGLRSISCTSYRGRTNMLLIWPDRKRRVEVFDSLSTALGAGADT